MTVYMICRVWVCVADDIIVFGTRETDTDLDAKLAKLLSRRRDVGIRLNAGKLKLWQYSVTFLGHVVSKDGLKHDPTVQDMPRPTDVAGVQRLNGFVNYLAKSLPGLSDLVASIRQLTRKDVPWTWSSAQENDIARMNQIVSDAPVLRYYDPERELTIQCDASQTGLGAALLQNGQPLAFVSRALTDAETGTPGSRKSYWPSSGQPKSSTSTFSAVTQPSSLTIVLWKVFRRRLCLLHQSACWAC